MIRDKILSRFQNLKGLPQLDPNTQLVMQAVLDPNVNAESIVSLVEKNIQITAHILKIANSVEYAGRFGEIKNLQQAIARIGMEELGKICLALTTIQAFPKPSALVDSNAFWRHSISVASITRLIVDGSKDLKIDPGEAYVAGLFHDIGVLLWDRFFPDVYKQFLISQKTSNENIFEIEIQEAKIDHGELAGILLKLWNVPNDIVEAVSFHHQPDKANPEAKALTQIVHVSDFYASSFGFVEPGDTLPKSCSQGAIHDLNLDSEYMMKIVEKVKAEISKSQHFM